MQQLVGQTVKSILISADETVLVFVCEEGKPFVFNATGDCCGCSYFNDIVGVEALIGQRVNMVTDVDMGVLDTVEEYETIQFYGIKLATSAGTATIVYRNESNGYYGGDCEFGGNVMPKGDFTAVTQDYPL